MLLYIMHIHTVWPEIMTGIKFDEIASKLHFKNMTFKFDEMTARVLHIIYLSREYEGDRQPLQCINITMFSAMLEIQNYVKRPPCLSWPTVGRHL